MGKLSIEVGASQWAIVTSDGRVIVLRGGFESEGHAKEVASALGPAQTGSNYTVGPVTVVTERKQPGRKASTPASTPPNASTATQPKPPTATAPKS